MNNQRRDFDAAAATWDEKPQRVRLAREVAEALVRHLGIAETMNVLDFGCGTGLLTLQLQPLVRTIVGADSSRGMLDVLNAKIAAAGWDNTCSMNLDLEQGDSLKGKYHRIVSSMTLHHVREIEPLLAQFHRALLPGGMVGLVDLDLEGGRFHDDNTGVFHFGFDRTALRSLLAAAGFTEVRDLTITEIVKQAGDGTTRNFSVFLIAARK
ncbi:class I SAM-dependent methyltransferase [Desulfobulbus sp.]|uniref:class I SAM-dependent DNA methyltransferase n=1 Tax=Desulfobulbus sp. TaxID=895 RepID=UPI00286F3B8A|nr:class I SAM-dependent methyltransferase [Desulfobulbus sp.]